MIIHELLHIVLCAIVAFIGYRYWRSLWVWVASYAIGFFLDADHLIDYLIFKGGISFNSEEFFSGAYFESTGKIYLIFHSYEAAIILAFIALLFWLKNRRFAIKLLVILLVLSSSLALHLIYDTLYYRPDWNAYFFLDRCSYHFELDRYNFH